MNLKWKKLTRAQQDLYITLLWQDGYSEQAIANFLETTKGTIVRRRQSHLQGVKRTVDRVKSEVESHRFRDLLALHDMEEMESNGIPAIAPVNERRETTMSEEEEEDRLVDLIRGRWRPQGHERPFNQLPVSVRREVRGHKERLMDKRRGLRPLHF